MPYPDSENRILGFIQCTQSHTSRIMVTSVAQQQPLVLLSRSLAVNKPTSARDSDQRSGFQRDPFVVSQQLRKYFSSLPFVLRASPISLYQCFLQALSVQICSSD